MKDGTSRYSNVAIVLHWIIAALVLWNIGVMFFTPEDVPARLMESHKAAGITVLVLSLVRLGWRLTHSWPHLSDHLARWEKVLARLTHVAFYVLMIVVPLAGWWMHSAASGSPISWFGAFEIPAMPVAQSRDAAGLFHEVHEYSAFMLIGLMALHVGGALKHSFVDKAPGLSRMWFGAANTG